MGRKGIMWLLVHPTPRRWRSYWRARRFQERANQWFRDHPDATELILDLDRIREWGK